MLFRCSKPIRCLCVMTLWSVECWTVWTSSSAFAVILWSQDRYPEAVWSFSSVIKRSINCLRLDPWTWLFSPYHTSFLCIHADSFFTEHCQLNTWYRQVQFMPVSFWSVMDNGRRNANPHASRRLVCILPSRTVKMEGWVLSRKDWNNNNNNARGKKKKKTGTENQRWRRVWCAA